MALVKCEECGHMISDKAKVCPNCGLPIEKKVEENEEENEKVYRHIYVGTNLSDGGTTGKTRLRFCLLAYFFGALGVHLFYIGKRIAGVINLVLLVVAILGWVSSMPDEPSHISYMQEPVGPDYTIRVIFCFLPIFIIYVLTAFQFFSALTMTQEDFEENFVDSNSFYPL